MVFFPPPVVSGGVEGTGVDPRDLLLYLNQRAREAKPVTFEILSEACRVGTVRLTPEVYLNP